MRLLGSTFCIFIGVTMVGILAIATIAGCSGTSNGFASDPSFTARVIPASANQLERISTGLRDGFKIDPAAYAIKSSSHNNAYHVAARVQGPGRVSAAVWSMSGSPEGAGIVLSANHDACGISDWPNGAATAAEAWTSDPDCKNLLAYVQSRQ